VETSEQQTNEQTADHVRRYGGVFALGKGPEYKQLGGLDVNLVVTPNMGSRGIGVTAGFHAPGQSFAPHRHPLSEEILIVFKGKGQFYLHDRWIDVSEGDVVYAPEGVLHGTRNPETNTETFITIGCASPPQLDMYQRSGYQLDSGPEIREDLV
jgi:quercetin dioxygenase-like cupin family protein